MSDWSTLLIGLGLGLVAAAALVVAIARWPHRHHPRHMRERGRR